MARMGLASREASASPSSASILEGKILTPELEQPTVRVEVRHYRQTPANTAVAYRLGDLRGVGLGVAVRPYRRPRHGRHSCDGASDYRDCDRRHHRAVIIIAIRERVAGRRF